MLQENAQVIQIILLLFGGRKQHAGKWANTNGPCIPHGSLFKWSIRVSRSSNVCLELSAKRAKALANTANDLHDLSSHDPVDSTGHLRDQGVLLDWLLASGRPVRNSPLSEPLRAESSTVKMGILSQMYRILFHELLTEGQCSCVNWENLLLSAESCECIVEALWCLAQSQFLVPISSYVSLGFTVNNTAPGTIAAFCHLYQCPKFLRIYEYLFANQRIWHNDVNLQVILADSHKTVTLGFVLRHLAKLKMLGELRELSFINSFHHWCGRSTLF